MKASTFVFLSSLTSGVCAFHVSPMKAKTSRNVAVGLLPTDTLHEMLASNNLLDNDVKTRVPVTSTVDEDPTFWSEMVEETKEDKRERLEGEAKETRSRLSWIKNAFKQGIKPTPIEKESYTMAEIEEDMFNNWVLSTLEEEETKLENQLDRTLRDMKSLWAIFTKKQ